MKGDRDRYPAWADAWWALVVALLFAGTAWHWAFAGVIPTVVIAIGSRWESLPGPPQ